MITNDNYVHVDFPRCRHRYLHVYRFFFRDMHKSSKTSKTTRKPGDGKAFLQQVNIENINSWLTKTV